jgi:transposase
MPSHLAPRAVLAVKGYDARANREAARKRGICPAIPYRSTAKNRPNFFPKQLYKGRARIEQAFGKIKRFKRVSSASFYVARKQQETTRPSSH